MKAGNRRWIFAALAVALAPLAASADDLWVKGNVVLRSDPNAAGADVERLTQGTPLTKVQEQGAWTKVSHGGKTGWVTTASLSIRPVKAPTGLLGGNTLAESGNAAAVKGITPTAVQFAQANHLDPAGVDQMEGFKKAITPQMLTDFMAEGNLGHGLPKPAPATQPAR